MKNKSVDTVSSLSALKYVLKAAPLSYAVMAFMGLLNGAAAVLSAFCVQRIFSAAEEGYSANLYLNIALYAVVLILSAAYSVWYMRYRIQFHTILNFESVVRKKLHAKSGRISNEELETPAAYALIRQADASRQNLFRYGQIYVESVMLVIEAVFLTAYLSSFHIWFLLFLPLATIPSFVERLYQARLWNKTYAEITQCKREEAEYEKAVSDETACKETRAVGADGLLIEKYKESHYRRDGLENRKSKSTFIASLALSAVKCAGSGGGFAVAILLYFYGEISLSAFTAAITAYSSLAAFIGSALATVGQEAQFKKMIIPFFEYWNMAERGGTEEACPFEKTIELKDVTFTYPNQKSPVIKNLNLVIRKGETLAVVGKNGAGKSTFANIILGLYRPTSGKVLYDGKDISLVKEEVLHKNRSAVFQNFIRYKLTAGENIAIGDFKKEDSALVKEKINDIFSDGEVDENMPLGKEFGGKELSGGQWQRLAIARGFYKDSDFVVLDEPTSAIDPLREKAVYDEFSRGLNGKTGVIITHRMGAVRLADRIIVLSGGTVVEEGTHEELLSLGGEYAKLWSAQAKAFSDK